MLDEHDRACALAHGDLEPDAAPRTLAVVFASPVARYLLHFGRDLGYRTVLVEPDVNRLTGPDRQHADAVEGSTRGAGIDDTADVVITDHDRAELGQMLHDVLALPARWVGVMGSPRHTAPHIAALRDLGTPQSAIARVHRPIGLNIGSKSPAEIAVATLAGLLADRNGRPGGFQF
ncbi:MAG: XdhC family protein [Acidimicrobiales bacterium]